MLQKVLVKHNKKVDKVYYAEIGLFTQVEEERVLVIETATPPVDGKANKKVIQLSAEFFGIAKSKVKIKSSKTSKIKILEIDTN